MMDVARLRRIARKPPSYLARRAADEVRQELLRVELGRAARGSGRLTLERLLPVDAADASRRTLTSAAPLLAADEAVAAVRADERLLERLRDRGRAALEREMELFGDAPVRVGTPPPWNTDPHSGHGWPLGHHKALDYRNLDRPSDIKMAWELSRLRHLVALAQWHAVDQPDGALAAFDGDLGDWIARNPMGWSVNWAVAMEVGLRAVNLVCADVILGERPGREALVRSLYQHGWFTARHLEVSDINGNHYLADAVGLVWLARYFEGIGEADRWMRTGREMLLDAARNQVLEDGLDHEGALPYHVLVLEMLLVGRHAGGSQLAAMDPALRRMVDALLTVLAPGGQVPNLGDDDGGRVLALAGTPSRDARRVLAFAAALLRHDGAAAAAGDGEVEDVIWLLGPEAVHRAAADPPRRPAHLDAAGVAVLGGGDDHVVVSCGPVGFRGRGGHGHVDALSVEAWLGGELALRDSGTASYTGDPELRNRLRDAPAHSVVICDDIPYARIGGVEALWAVTGDAPPVARLTEREPELQVLELEQQLPSRRGPARVRRRVEWRPGRLRITDSLDAPAGTSVAALLHTPPLEATSTGFASQAHAYAVSAPADAEVTAVEHPWSEAYGSVGTGTCLRLEVVASAGELTWSWDVSAR